MFFNVFLLCLKGYSETLCFTVAKERQELIAKTAFEKLSSNNTAEI